MFNQDFKEFLQLLNEHDVRYLIIGGYAVAFHGHPRYTKDLDVWIWVDPTNASRMIEALNHFGFGSLGLKPDDFLNTENVIQLGFPPNRIDLIMSPSGVDFKTCYENKIESVIDGVQVHFISLQHLRDNKKAAGRHQDLADLENLK